MSPERRALYCFFALSLMLCMYAFGSTEKPPFVKFRQMGKMQGDVYVNRGYVMQIRPGLKYDSMIVFSTGAFIEVQGVPADVERRLEE